MKVETRKETVFKSGAKALMAAIVVAGPVLLSGPAEARFCSKPHAPNPPTFKPHKPMCMRSSGTNNCQPHETDRFFREVAEYTRTLSRYIEEAERFPDKATRYAQCELADLAE